MRKLTLATIVLMLGILAFVQNVEASATLNGSNWTEVNSITDSTGFVFLKDSSDINANNISKLNVTVQITRDRVLGQTDVDVQQNGTDAGQNTTEQQLQSGINYANQTTTNLANYLNNTYAGSSVVTIVGTIANGIWQGTQIADAYLVSGAKWSSLWNSQNTTNAQQNSSNQNTNDSINKTQSAFTTINNTDSTQNAKFDAQNSTNNLKWNKTDNINTSLIIARSQVIGQTDIDTQQNGTDAGQNTTLTSGNYRNRTIAFSFNNGTNNIATGYKAVIVSDFSGSIIMAKIRHPTSGSVSISFSKATDANYITQTWTSLCTVATSAVLIANDVTSCNGQTIAAGDNIQAVVNSANVLNATAQFTIQVT